MNGVGESALPLEESCDQIDLRDALAILTEDGFLTFSVDRDGRKVWRPASNLVRPWGRNTIS
ncbi:MAG: hypothetical protein V1816_11635 [Pseudomonadota bacterium]